MRRLTTEQFIAKAREVHADRYDYADVTYTGSGNKVLIRCRAHGTFLQAPGNHLTGMGCPKCGLQNLGVYNKKDTEDFIREARQRHGDAYDYAPTSYKGAREKLTVTCPKHGPFDQTAFVHLQCEPRAACPKCSYERRGGLMRMTAEEFIERARLVHGDTYDYSTVPRDYKDASSAVTIKCKLHGEFNQEAHNHLAGKGCPRCSVARTGDALRKSSDNFVGQAKAVHGDKYDYSRVKYLGAFDPVEIGCPLDGVFVQSPTSHLGGTGCPRCSRRGQGAPRNLTRALRGEFDQPKASFVYVIQFQLPGSETDLFKVGSGTGTRLGTARSEIRRVGGSDSVLARFQFSSAGEAIVFEHLAHAQVSHYKYVVPPELKFPGHTEVFTQNPNLDEVERHPTMTRFRAGERWDPRVVPAELDSPLRVPRPGGRARSPSR